MIRIDILCFQNIDSNEAEKHFPRRDKSGNRRLEINKDVRVLVENRGGNYSDYCDEKG